MQVRRATADDAEAFAGVICAVAAEGRWIATEATTDLDATVQRVHGMFEAGDALWVLEDEDGRVIGNLGLHATRVRGVVTLGIAVVAGSRGRGGGRALMDAALEYAQGSDLHKVELEVWPDNGPAIALYKRYGFEVEGLRRNHYRRADGTLRSAVLMARLLGS